MGVRITTSLDAMQEPATAAIAAALHPEDAPVADPKPDPRPGTAAWWLAREEQPTRKRRRRSLTLEAVLEASLTLLDARGADALTMRSVAGALGCSQASLYRHVRNREELVTLLYDRAISVAST